MGQLFILRRPGIIVVSGLVTEANGDEVVIENDCYLPVSQRTEKRRCRVQFPAGRARSLSLTEGAFVIASVKDDFRVEMLMEGGETPDREYRMAGFQIRYTGPFDFARHGREKEQHVFSGSILSSRSGGSEGRFWTLATIGWKRRGEAECRDVVLWGKDKPPACETGRRTILVTGERREQDGRPYYHAAKMI